MPRPRSLTPAAIATATLAVIDHAGLAALTMRAVAKELGMATMSLYRYVKDKDQLETLVVDHVLAGISLDLPPGDWRSSVTILLGRLRDAVCAHREMVPLLLRHRHNAPASLRWIEAMLEVLTEAGFTGQDRVIAQRTIVGYLLGALQNEHYVSLAGAGTAAMTAMTEFPLLAETATEGRKLSAATEFHSGLEIVLRGLERQTRPSRRSR